MAKYLWDPEIIVPEDSKQHDEARRQKDNLDGMPDGFTFKPHGRDGWIYYRDGHKVLEMYWEMSGTREYDLLIHSSQLHSWSLPTCEPLSNDDREKITARLVIWGSKNNLKIEINSG